MAYTLSGRRRRLYRRTAIKIAIGAIVLYFATQLVRWFS